MASNHTTPYQAIDLPCGCRTTWTVGKSTGWVAELCQAHSRKLSDPDDIIGWPTGDRSGRYGEA